MGEAMQDCGVNHVALVCRDAAEAVALCGLQDVAHAPFDALGERSSLKQPATA
jgi:hypothetical protein